MRRWIIGGCIALILAILCSVAITNLPGHKPQPTSVERQTEETATTVPASRVSTEPPPFDPKGAKSWTEWFAKANTQKDKGNLGWWESLADLHFGGNTNKAFAAVKYQVTKESELGLDHYVRRVPDGDGMSVTNTSPQGKSYRALSSVLKPGDTYLVMDKDNPVVSGAGKEAKSPTDAGKEQPAIRRKCGNAIKVSPPKKKVAKKVTPCPKKRNPKATQAVQDNPPSLVKPTKGYDRGNAEQVVQDQNSSPPADSTHHPTYGSPGTGAGGTTPVGTGDGESAAPPSGDPPDEGYQGEEPAGTVPED